jgi:hypothetical protein
MNFQDSCIRPIINLRGYLNAISSSPMTNVHDFSTGAKYLMNRNVMRRLSHRIGFTNDTPRHAEVVCLAVHWPPDANVNVTGSKPFKDRRYQDLMRLDKRRMCWLMFHNPLGVMLEEFLDDAWIKHARHHHQFTHGR